MTIPQKEAMATLATASRSITSKVPISVLSVPMAPSWGYAACRDIHFALYSERAAIPRQTVHELKPDGKLGKQLTDQTVSRGSIVREMEVDIFLTVETARSLAEWLDVEIGKASKSQRRT